MIEEKAKSMMLSEPFKQLDSYIMNFFKKNSCTIIKETNGKQIPFGSGTFVKIKGKVFVATAAHVVKKWALEETIVGTYDCRFFGVSALGFDGGGEFDRLDIAWLEPKLGESEKEILKCSIDFDEIDDTYEIDTNSLAYLTGYPWKLYEPDKRKIALLAYRTVFPENPKYIDLSTPEHHVVLNYPEGALDDNMESTKMPAARGYSGGGIWRMRLGKANILSNSETRLIGIDTAWSEKLGLVIGNQIGLWKNLVRKERPDLFPKE